MMERTRVDMGIDYVPIVDDADAAVLLMPDMSVLPDMGYSVDASRMADSMVDAANMMEQEPSDAATSPIIEPEFSLRLPIGDAVIQGPHSRLSDGLILLDPTASLRWVISNDKVPVGARLTAALKSTIWRYEDSEIQVRVGSAELTGSVWGDGRGNISEIRQLYREWMGDGYGADRPPKKIEWRIDGPVESIELRAIGGGILVGDLYLLGPTASTPLPILPESVPAMTTLDYRACAEDDCDDGAALTEAIGSAPDGSVSIRLIDGSYTGRTPIRIGRSDVHISGIDDNGQRTIWNWAPRPGSGQRWPFEIRGAGPAGEQGALIMNGTELGQRIVEVDGLLDDIPQWVRLTAMDFGEVPPSCVLGRDVEKYNRHQRQLFRVLSGERLGDKTRLVLDRAIHVAIPAEAQAKMTPVSLLTGVRIENLHLQAECPETTASTFVQVQCTNSEVLDDGGILSLYTDGTHIESVSGQGFGKFTIEIRDSLRNRISKCSMDYPSAYGSGGQGYGVHLIGASRTVIDEQRVQFARHGVVIDFGSSDSQVLNGEFSDMNQALLDVHGEASRDSLIRGNVLRDGTVGVIVGGGGRQVHCNDGPRHHIVNNTIQGCNLSAVSVNDSTRDIFVRSNTMTNNSTHVNANFGGHRIRVERNRIGEAGLTPISVALEGSGGITVIRNRFDVACRVADAFLALLGGEPPQFIDNIWCPQ